MCWIGNNILAESSESGQDGDGSSDEESDVAPWLPQWLSFLSGISEARRRKRLLVNIQTLTQGFVDDSGGKGQGKVFFFSALISEAERWAQFSDQWDACLKEQPSIRYFKMREAAALSDEFYGVSVHERDTKLKRLCRIISELGPTELACGFNLIDLAKTWGKSAGRPLCEPYFFPFHATIMGVGYEVLRQGKREPFEIFFDENAVFGPRAKAWYPMIRETFDAELRVVTPVEPFFRSDIDTLPLQAADMTAWLRRRFNEDSPIEFEWMLPELSGIIQSPLSKLLEEKMIDAMRQKPEGTPEQIAKREALLKKYREVFGHEWPPKTKKEAKRHRGQ